MLAKSLDWFFTSGAYGWLFVCMWAGALIFIFWPQREKQ